MEANNKNPYEINSFHMDEGLQSNIVEWNKKRKIHTNELSLPIPKHKCCNRSFSSEVGSMFYEYPASQAMQTCMIMEESVAVVRYGDSELESEKDSNSIMEDSDSNFSINGEAKHEADSANMILHGLPSTSSVYWRGDNMEHNNYSSDRLSVEDGDSSHQNTFSGVEYDSPNHDADVEALLNLDEHLLGLGKHEDTLFPEFGNGGPQKCNNLELEDIHCSNGVNPNIYVLSSGMRSASQEVQSGTREQTIDQEFEQYFSMLML